MWIVQLALRRTYTFVVMALLIAAVSGVAIYRMSTDIFPEIDIPVVSVVWQFTGMPADEIERRIILINERVLTTSVNDIEHIESQSMFGVGRDPAVLLSRARIEAAVAQVTATSQAILKTMPPGINPPFIVQYSATSVPVVQIAVSSETLTEQQIFDYAANFIIQRLGTVQGARVPQPWGGKWPQVMVDLDLDELYARGLSPQDIQGAISTQNLIIPAGTAKIGPSEYYVKLNSSPDLVAAFNDIPVKSVNGVPVFLKDVAQVRMGYMVQTNVVRRDGRRAVLMTILKGEGSSTLSVVNRLRAALPGIQAQLPPELKLDLLFDQSVFVRAAVEGVLKEGAIAAGLTALMILLFLGSWRSTLIVAVSIPLSILTGIIILWAMGESLNTMTLGGMALAVGILVDDATVEIENIHRNLGMRKPIRRAILDGAAQIAVPAFVSTLAICIVFVPVIFLTGPAASLFTPLALAVVFSMMASYFLSRTLVPTMVLYLLPPEVELYAARAEGEAGTTTAVRTAARSGGSTGLQPAFRAAAGVVRAAAGLVPGASGRDADLAAGLRPGLAGAGPLDRPRLLPGRRRRPVPAARPGAVRHPDRGDRADLRPDRGRHPRGRPRARARADPRQHGDVAVVHRAGLCRQRHGQQRRRRDPRRPEGGALADGRITSPSCGPSCPGGSPTASSSSSRPTSPARSSTSACPRRSTSRWWASTARATSPPPRSSGASWRRSPASPTSTSTRSPTSRPCGWTWTASWPRRWA